MTATHSSITVAPATITTASGPPPPLWPWSGHLHRHVVPGGPVGTVDFTDATTPVSTGQGVALMASAPDTATCTLTATHRGRTRQAPITRSEFHHDSASTPLAIPSTQLHPARVSTTSVPAATAGSAYPRPRSLPRGAGPETWSVTSMLPPGLTLDASSGTRAARRRRGTFPSPSG